jgi:hypothetical protein
VELRVPLQGDPDRELLSGVWHCLSPVPGGTVAAAVVPCTPPSRVFSPDGVSEAGCRFVERMLTPVQTRRLQGRSVLRYLYDALVAPRNGLPAPSLLAAE